MAKFGTDTIRDLREVREDLEHGLVFEKTVSIPLRNSDLPVRCNVYRPLTSGNERFPVLVTYGPYGKNIPYATYASSKQQCAKNLYLVLR